MYYEMEAPIAARAAESARAAFIRRTYAHVAGAVLALVALEFLLLNLPGIDHLATSLVASPATWLIVVAAFIGFGYLAEVWARSETSAAVQYVGLALYVVLEAVIFLPLLYIVLNFIRDDTLIPTAGILTLAMFGGLTVAAFATRKDFSFLGPILMVGGFLALGGVVAFAFVGSLSFGLIVAFFIVALASATILYQTSNVIHHYRTDQHVAAALGLFASIATLFYHILWILAMTRE
jgi:FtsH-binding integral membrane protein